MNEAIHSSPSIPSELQLIDLKAAARLDCSGRGGRPPHISTITRWIQQGVCLCAGDRLYLQAVRVPSGWRTTRRWLDEFRRALTADRLGRDLSDESEPESVASTPSTRAASSGCRSAAERRTASQRAGELLKAMGS
jgi:hypothetical protein